jgi:hypothetical protein
MTHPTPPDKDKMLVVPGGYGGVIKTAFPLISGSEMRKNWTKPR